MHAQCASQRKLTQPRPLAHATVTPSWASVHAQLSWSTPSSLQSPGEPTIRTFRSPCDLQAAWLRRWRVQPRRRGPLHLMEESLTMRRRCAAISAEIDAARQFAPHAVRAFRPFPGMCFLSGGERFFFRREGRLSGCGGRSIGYRVGAVCR